MERVIYLKENPGRIKDAQTLFTKIDKIKIDHAQENFLVFFLDNKLKLIDTEILFKGGINSCLIDPRIVFRRALLKNSCSIIIAHNHPSGDLSPSDEDKEVFDKLKEIGKILDLRVLDSIIFNKTKYYSLVEAGA